jgi:transcriptional regulator with XRE-family HTH domain
MDQHKSEAYIIGENIRRIREEKRLSQKELAASIDVAPTQYSRVETGKVMPTLKTLVKIAKILGVSVDTLIDENGLPAQDVTIKDKTLFDKVKLIDQLPEQEKNMILQVIDLALSKKKFKDLLQQID